MRSLTTIEFIVESGPMTARGLPHSDISGSSLLSSYPELFAAWYVLHRLWSQGIHLVLFHIFDVNCTRNDYGNKPLRAASCVNQHMKVLLYAVFKDPLSGTGGSLKAEQCSTLTVNPYSRSRAQTCVWPSILSHTSEMPDRLLDSRHRL